MPRGGVLRVVAGMVMEVAVEEAGRAEAGKAGKVGGVARVGVAAVEELGSRDWRERVPARIAALMPIEYHVNIIQHKTLSHYGKGTHSSYPAAYRSNSCIPELSTPPPVR